MDIILVMLIVAIIVIFLKRTFSGFIYSLIAVDIFLRIITFVKLNIASGEFFEILNKYFPENIPDIINKYTNGIFNTALIWLFVAAYIVFEYYTVRILFKKK